MASYCAEEDVSNMSVVIVGPFVAGSVTVRDEHRASVFEGRVLGEMFGSEREEMRGDWRKLHSEELHGLCCSPNTISVIK